MKRIHWKALYSQDVEHKHQAVGQLLWIGAMVGACANAPAGYGWYTWWVGVAVFCMVQNLAWSITGDVRTAIVATSKLRSGETLPVKDDDDE